MCDLPNVLGGFSVLFLGSLQCGGSRSFSLGRCLSFGEFNNICGGVNVSTWLSWKGSSHLFLKPGMRPSKLQTSQFSAKSKVDPHKTQSHVLFVAAWREFNLKPLPPSWRRQKCPKPVHFAIFTFGASGYDVGVRNRVKGNTSFRLKLI